MPCLLLVYPACEWAEAKEVAYMPVLFWQSLDLRRELFRECGSLALSRGHLGLSTCEGDFCPWHLMSRSFTKQASCLTAVLERWFRSIIFLNKRDIVKPCTKRKFIMVTDGAFEEGRIWLVFF